MQITNLGMEAGKYVRDTIKLELESNVSSATDLI